MLLRTTGDPMRCFSQACLVLSLILGTAADARSTAGPDGFWVPGPGSDAVSGRPVGRFLHAAAVDTSGGRMFVTGGYQQPLGELWVLRIASDPAVWKLLAPGTPGPGPRIGPVIVYDGDGDRVILMGGQIHGTQVFKSDVWQFSLVDSVWSEIVVPGASPAARAFQSAVWDSARTRMLIFGGENGSGGFDDTWALSFQGSPQWIRLATTGQAPGPRAGMAFLHDPDGDRVYLFGGRRLGTRFNDLWTLPLTDGSEWEMLATTGPRPGGRSNCAAAFRRGKDSLVVYGGEAGAHYSDTWSLSLSPSLQWHQAQTDPLRPGSRNGSAGVYDAARDRMVIFGGNLPSELPEDTWAWDFGAATWAIVDAVGSPESPPARADHMAVLRKGGSTLFALGGYSANGGNGRSDVWRLDLGLEPVWSRELAESVGLPGEPGLVCVYDPVDDRIVVVSPRSFQYPVDMWSVVPGGTWTPITPPGTRPPPQAERGIAYDSKRHQILLTGFAATGGWEVWSWSLDTGDPWVRLTAQAPSPVRVVWGNSSVYDAVDDQLVVIGGQFNAEVWALRFQPTLHWIQLSTPSGPTTRGEHAITLDTRRRRILLAGGHAGGASLGDLWEFALAEPREWRLLQPPGPSPLPRGFHSLAYDETWDRVILFGGHNGRFLGDTWYLQFDQPTATGISLVHTETDETRARLEWHVGAESQHAFRVQRRAASTDWRDIATVSADGRARVVFEDEGLEPGSTYGYQLSWFGTDGRRSAGEFWVTTKASGRLVLSGIVPNPASRALSLRYAARAGFPVEIRVIDVQGRVVLTQTRMPTGGAPEELRVAVADLAPGLYYLVARQAGEQRLTRFAVMR
jgi:hypothetical protein